MDRRRGNEDDHRSNDDDGALADQWWEAANLITRQPATTPGAIAAKALVVRAIARDVGEPDGPLERAVASLVADLLAYAAKTA